MKRKIISLLLYLFGGFCVKMEPIVTISQGILNGTLQQSRNGRIYSAFLGVPYGKPPIGNLRFANPEPAENWDGIRQADTFGNICPQFSGSDVVGSEDCLFLDIYTPVLNFNSSSSSGQSLLPVMVWLHGGVFVFGSGSFYRAEFLLDKNIILVTINYRLGIFGFFTTGDSSSPGNYGLKDQVLALKWIQKNIKNFGGDPNQVTLFGESAGAASITIHAISNQTDGLFQKYILQSGSFMSPWAYQSNEGLKLHAKGIGALLFCPFIFSKNLVNCMRRKSVKNLMDTSSLLPLISWTPTNEPNIEGAFLTENPVNLMNRIRPLPFMCGINTNEGLIVSSLLKLNKYIPSLIKLITRPIIFFVSNYYLNGYKNSNLTEGINKFYFNKKTISGDNNLFVRNFTRFISDAFFFYPQLKMLENVTSKMKNPNYFYNFGYRGPFSLTNVTIGNNKNIGVSHTDEINFLFLSKPEDFGLKSENYTKKDEFIIDVMVDLWTSFAINGKPTSEKLNPSDLWQPFNSGKSTHLRIGDINNNTKPSVTLSDSFYPERMKFWKKHAPIWN